MNRRAFVGALFAPLILACAKEEPNERANALFVEAMNFLNEARSLTTEPADRAYRNAIIALDDILSKYPTSNLAVQLSSGQQIGDFSRSEIEKKLIIQSASMRPTLRLGQPIAVLKYKTFIPKAGHLIAYEHPNQSSTFQVFRLIALANERVQMIGGALHLNGQAVKREQLADFVETEEDRPTKIKRWRETLPNGETYETLDLIDNGFYDNTPVHTLAPGQLFVLADNRDNGTDSRVPAHGYVPYRNVLGRAIRI